jgi:hypothetical protein
LTWPAICFFGQGLFAPNEAPKVLGLFFANSANFAMMNLKRVPPRIGLEDWRR